MQFIELPIQTDFGPPRLQTFNLAHIVSIWPSMSASGEDECGFLSVAAHEAEMVALPYEAVRALLANASGAAILRARGPYPVEDDA